MHDFASAFGEAFRLIATFDSDLREIVFLSLRVSLTAVVAAAIVGLPLGALLGITRFPGRNALVIGITALMGLPPVVVGLMVYLLLSNAGVLGPLQLLYTPTAMIIAQTILITPIIAALARQTIEDLNNEYDLQMTLFGINRWQRLSTLLWEARFALMTTLLAGFGRAIAEVGAVIVVGGNINHVTRVMTTTIALETAKGNLALALGLGIILVAIAVAVNAMVFALRGTAERAAYA